MISKTPLTRSPIYMIEALATRNAEEEVLPCQANYVTMKLNHLTTCSDFAKDPNRRLAMLGDFSTHRAICKSVRRIKAISLSKTYQSSLLHVCLCFFPSLTFIQASSNPSKCMMRHTIVCSCIVLMASCSNEDVLTFFDLLNCRPYRLFTGNS